MKSIGLRICTGLLRLTVSVGLVMTSLVGLMMLTSTASHYDHTIANGKEMDGQLRAFGGAVLQFEQLERRLPDANELKLILPPEAYGRYEVELTTDATNCEPSRPSDYRRLKATPYVVSAWRGEWWECFAPREGLTTVATTAIEFTTLGSFLADRIAGGLTIIASLAGALWLWGARAPGFRPPTTPCRHGDGR